MAQLDVMDLWFRGNHLFVFNNGIDLVRIECSIGIVEVIRS